jgi:hypothetical protein
MNIPSAGRRLRSRVLRGATFNNVPRDVRAAYRNNNRPANRNNAVGLRVASTSRWIDESARPESGGAWPLRSVPRCEVQVVALCRPACRCRPKET